MVELLNFLYHIAAIQDITPFKIQINGYFIVVYVFVSLRSKASIGFCNLFKLLWHNKATSCIAWEAYISFIMSCCSYCWPAVYDITSSFFSKLCSLKKIIFM